jgi:hypothetical protein
MQLLAACGTVETSFFAATVAKMPQVEPKFCGETFQSEWTFLVTHFVCV